MLSGVGDRLSRWAGEGDGDSDLVVYQRITSMNRSPLHGAVFTILMCNSHEHSCFLHLERCDCTRPLKYSILDFLFGTQCFPASRNILRRLLPILDLGLNLLDSTQHGSKYRVATTISCLLDQVSNSALHTTLASVRTHVPCGKYSRYNVHPCIPVHISSILTLSSRRGTGGGCDKLPSSEAPPAAAS